MLGGFRNRCDDLVRRLHEADGPADLAGFWPDSIWEILKDAGAPGWSLPKSYGGAGLDRLVCEPSPNSPF